MANQFQSTSSGSSILKNYYQGPLIDALNNEVPIYRAAEKQKKGWSGAQVIRSLRTVRNQGVGATSDGGTLPKIGRQGYVQATIPAKFNYLRFGITAAMMKASQSDVGSFVRSAADELEKGYLDLKTEISRQLSWDGTGDLALVNTASSASTTLVVKGRTTSEPALKYLDVGSTFDVLNASDVVVASGITISSITTGTASSTTATVVLDQPITTSANYVLIRSGSNGSELSGLFYALDGGTGTVYGIVRTTSLAYQGNVSDISSNANTQLSIDALQNPFNEGLRRGPIGKYNAMWTDFTTLRYYQKLLVPDKRYTTMEGDGTFGSKGQFYLDFNGIPVVPDKDMSLKVAMLPAEVLTMYELCAMEFADETGSQFIPVSDQDVLEVRVRHFVNLFNEAPQACAVLTGYTSP